MNITSYQEELGDGIHLDMIYIPEGSFLMGSSSEEGSYDDELPQHQVTIPTFFMGKYPITQVQWQVVASLPKVERDLILDPSYFKGSNLPVEQVSWYDAVEFCQRLSRTTGKEYRLPSESEWEYSCRAGTITPFNFSDNESQLGYYAWFKGNSDRKTNPVGEKRANPWGLYDVHGNVWEWCADTWHKSYADKPENIKQNGNIAWVDGNIINQSLMLLRGGSWFSNPEYCRSAYRDFSNPDFSSLIVGLRVVCALR